MVSGKGARQKGLQFERDISADLRDIGFKDAGRHLESQKDEAVGVDIKNTFPFAIQCKRNKGYCSVGKIKEIQVNRGHTHVLVTKGDHMEPICAMYWDDFLEMAKLLKENELI